MKRITVFVLLIALVLSANTQTNLDLLGLSGRYGFPQPYENTYSGKATETGGLVNLTAPLPISESARWFISLTYTPFFINNDEVMPADIANPVKLHGVILQTGLVKKFDNGRTIQLFLAPRYMMEAGYGGGDNFQIGATAMYEKIYHERLMMRYGAFYHQELGGPYLVPIVYSDWLINDKWSLVGMWPIYGKLIYQVNNNFSTGFSHFGLLQSYRLGHPAYEGDYIERSSIDLTLFGRIRVAGRIHLEGRAGYALGRSYAQYAADQTVPFRITVLKFGDDRVAKNVEFNSGPIIELRLVYNLHVKDDHSY